MSAFYAQRFTMTRPTTVTQDAKVFDLPSIVRLRNATIGAGLTVDLRSAIATPKAGCLPG